ncbi:unnamed protein product [Schistocephalus solidus]|uniref:MerR family transcriptional regulator n=1 Tax=Schistocephalus solidus TaxID=70667 RepID=A0A183SU67_SCHSO|nr:unnamed protein product [Schistocephalus solidus]
MVGGGMDLIDVTYTKHYTNYRLTRLTEAMDAAGFSTQDGRDPLTQLEAEKKAHQTRLDKLVEEMDNVYVEKVRERENRLRDTERDMTERIEIMRQQLEAEAEDLAAERQRFNDERLSWELDNRDYADRLVNQCLEHQHTAEIAASTVLTILAHALIAWAYSVTCASMTAEFTAMPTTPIHHAHPPLLTTPSAQCMCCVCREADQWTESQTAMAPPYPLKSFVVVHRGVALAAPALAPSPISGLLDSVLTPGSGGGGEESVLAAPQG